MLTQLTFCIYTDVRKSSWGMVSLGLLILVWVKCSTCLVGFDCSHRGINVTTIAMDYVPGCQIDQESVTPTEEMIQLVQVADSYPLHVYQCKVRILRHVTHCGMHSHSSEVRGGMADYLRKVTAPECVDMHKNRRLSLGGVIIDDLPLNSSTTRAIVLAGKISGDGTCEGHWYSDMFGSWSQVVVQGTVSITLSDYTASADTTADTISLRSGLSCRTSLGECMDTEHGFTTWSSDRITKCDRRKHMVLYEGVSQVFRTVGRDGIEVTTYMVDRPEKVFGLRTLTTYEGCMFKAYTTEHPKLIIIPKSTQSFYFEQTDLNPSSMDLMAYVNSKFVFVDKIHTRNTKELYTLVATQRCAVERRSLQTLLSLANINPQEFAYSYTGQAGFTALRLGEVVHLIQCMAVDVKIRATSVCYHELPVQYLNKSMFLTPRSRLLQGYGTEIDCDNLVNAQFRLEGVWYAIGTTRHPVPAPLELAPTPIEGWEPKSIDQLAKAGIYTYEESEKLRQRVMNPYEREAINNILVRGVSGKEFERQGITLTGLVDEDMVDDLGTKIGKKIWGFFSVFGNISAGVIGIYMLCRLVKFGLDTLIHCRAIYEVYGLSIALLGGVWDSLTNYLLHRKREYDPESASRRNKGDKPVNGKSEDACREANIAGTGANCQIEMHPFSPPTAPLISNEERSKTLPNQRQSLYPSIPHTFSMP